MKKMDWTVVCDFDGTITPEDVTDEVLARFARPEWTALESQWRAGAIGSRACMAGQVALLECSRPELDGFLATVDIDPRFPEFVAAVEARGWRLVVMSDGIEYACRSILARHGLGAVPLFANRLVQAGAREWRLEFPHTATGCAAGHCKCARSITAAGTGPLLLIGDGASDFCVARQANVVWARGALYEHCIARGIACEAVEDFGEALRRLPGLAARRPITLTPEILYR